MQQLVCALKRGKLSDPQIEDVVPVDAEPDKPSGQFGGFGHFGSNHQAVEQAGGFRLQPAKIVLEVQEFRFVFCERGQREDAYCLIAESLERKQRAIPLDTRIVDRIEAFPDLPAQVGGDRYRLPPGSG